MTRSNSNLIAELRDMVLPRQASSQSSCAWDRRMGVGFASRIGAGRCLPIVVATATVGKRCNTAATVQTLHTVCSVATLQSVHTNPSIVNVNFPRREKAAAKVGPRLEISQRFRQKTLLLSGEDLPSTLGSS